MGLINTADLKQLLESRQNPNLFPDATDTFVAKKELDDALNSRVDIETNPSNFSDFFGSNRNVNNPENLARGQLSDFISSVEYNLVNKFKVYINGPDLSQFNFPKNGVWQSLTTCAERVDMPGKMLQATSFRMSSLPEIDLPFSLDYGRQLAITFRVSRDYAERNLFLKWQELIYPTVRTLNPYSDRNVKPYIEPNSGVNYYDVYAKNFTITVASLNTQGQSNMITKFYGVYPIRVDGLIMDWAVSDYVRQTVMFSFYKSHTITGSEV
jgi:hypothetical protein